MQLYEGNFHPASFIIVISTSHSLFHPISSSNIHSKTITKRAAFWDIQLKLLSRFAIFIGTLAAPLDSDMWECVNRYLQAKEKLRVSPNCAIKNVPKRGNSIKRWELETSAANSCSSSIFITCRINLYCPRAMLTWQRSWVAQTLRHVVEFIKMMFWLKPNRFVAFSTGPRARVAMMCFG